MQSHLLTCLRLCLSRQHSIYCLWSGLWCIPTKGHNKVCQQTASVVVTRPIFLTYCHIIIQKIPTHKLCQLYDIECHLFFKWYQIFFCYIAKRITPLVCNPGRVMLTSSRLYFQPFNNADPVSVIKRRKKFVYCYHKKKTTHKYFLCNQSFK